MQKLRIAQISNLVAPITDSSTNGLAQIVYHLTQELVDLGHDVTLYAPLHSSTKARLVPLSGLPNASETILGKVLPVAAAFSDWRHFDIIHDHTRFYSSLSAHLVPFPSSQRFTIRSNSTNSTGTIQPKNIARSSVPFGRGLSRASTPFFQVNFNELTLMVRLTSYTMAYLQISGLNQTLPLANTSPFWGP